MKDVRFKSECPINKINKKQNQPLFIIIFNNMVFYNTSIEDTSSLALILSTGLLEINVIMNQLFVVLYCFKSCYTYLADCTVVLVFP